MGDQKFIFVMFGLLAMLAILLFTIEAPSDKKKKTLSKTSSKDVKKTVVTESKEAAKKPPVKSPVKAEEPKVGTAEEKKINDTKTTTKKPEEVSSENIDNALVASYKGDKIIASEFIAYYNKLDSMKKVSLAKKSLFSELLRFYVQIQVSHKLAIEKGYQNRYEVTIPLKQQKQWFVVEKTVFENVQAKATVSDKELKEYYEKIKKKEYKIGPAVEGVIFSSVDMIITQKIRTEIENGVKLDVIKKNNASEYKANIRELKLVKQGQRGKEFDKNVIQGDFIGCSKVFTVNGAHTFFNVIKRIPSGFKSFDSVKSFLTTKLKSIKARQFYDVFLKGLVQKYSAKVDNDILKKVVSFCRTKLESFNGKPLRDIIDNKFDTFYEDLQKSIPEKFNEELIIAIKGNDITSKDFVNMCFVIPAFYSRKGNKIDEYVVNLANRMRDQEVLYIDGINSGYDKDKSIVEKLAEFKRDIITNEFTRQILRNYVDFSDTRLKKYFDEHPKEFIELEKIKVSHILVKTAEEIGKIKKDIEDNNILFEDAAKKFSTCPSSKSGGDLGWFARGRMTPVFEKAAFELKKPGEMSGIVNTNFGYHLIKLTEKKDGSTKKFEESKNVIKNKIHRKERKGIEEKARKDILLKGDVKFSDGIFDRLYYHLFPSEKPEKPVVNDKKSSLPVDKSTPVNEPKPNEKTDVDEKKIEKSLGNIEINPTMVEVAKLGDRVFSLQDIREKYNDIPYQLKVKYKGDKGDKGVVKCLQDMLMEWSIYFDGVDQGLLKTPRVKMMIDNIDKVITVQAILSEGFESKDAISEKEIKLFYDSNKIKFTVPEQIKIREIVTEDKAVAEVALDKLKKGEKFVDLVKRYSLGRSKTNGGLINFFPKGKNSEEFDKIAFALKKNEFSGIVKDKRNYKIVKVIDRIESSLKPLKEVNKGIENYLKKERKVKVIDDKIKDLKKKYHFNENVKYIKIVSPEELEKAKDEKLFIFDKGSMSVGEFFKQLDNLPANIRNSVTPDKRHSILKSMENVYLLYTLKDKLSPKMLKEVGKIRERKKVKALAAQVQAEKVKEIVNKIKITDDEILKYYNKNKEIYSVPSKRKVRQILVKTEKEALDIIEELKKGTDFIALAKSRSIDKGSATKGGDIGFVAENQVIKPLGKVLIELDVGEISTKPIKTGFGYYILKVEEKTPAKIAELSKLRSRILAKLKKDAQFAEIDKWRLKLSRKYNGVIYEKKLLKMWNRK